MTNQHKVGDIVELWTVIPWGYSIERVVVTFTLPAMGVLCVMHHDGSTQTLDMNDPDIKATGESIDFSIILDNIQWSLAPDCIDMREEF